MKASNLFSELTAQVSSYPVKRLNINQLSFIVGLYCHLWFPEDEAGGFYFPDVFPWHHHDVDSILSAQYH